MQVMVPLYGFGGGSEGSGATLTVTAPAGATVTVSKDGKSKTRVADSSGAAVFKGLSSGEWTVTISDDTGTNEDTVQITADYTKEMSYYGIFRDITVSSPVWAREGASEDKTATASVGTVAGASDFGSCYPWSGIQRETLSSGDVMVKIPKFWFRRFREGNIEHIQIAPKPTDGFTLHPAFNHAGVEKDCIYVGAYKTSSNNKSVSGASPQVSQTRATMRANAKAKGDGWGLIDIAAVSAIQMLILVEYANNDVQSKMGRGYCDGNSEKTNVGTCDSVPNLTGRPAGTDGKVDVVWRGIEGFWGNAWEYVDGVNWNDGKYFVCNDPSKYADDTAANYEQLSFTGALNWSSSYITEEGIDTGNNGHVMLPSAAGSGSESTYQCDGCFSNTGWRVLMHGGEFLRDSLAGLFCDAVNADSSNDGTAICSRLQYIPQ